MKTSKDIYSEACDVLTGGLSRNTVYRQPHPNYVERASGCYIHDIDGVRRIDFANNMAALIHGHAHPAITHAVIRQLKAGTAYTMACETEVKFAKHLCERIPSMERMRFVNSGTEAVMAMIKASRAYTGRPKIAKAEGTYHGTYDFAEVSQAPGPQEWGDINEPNSVPLVYGTPKNVLKDVIIFPYNDIERTLAILDKNAREIACVLIDPIPHRVGLFPGSSQYLEAVHNWTRKNGALLAFDEVVTLRVNHGGAQEKYAVKPDLTALGKIIGGGFPVGAFGGRKDIMKIMDPRQSHLPFPHSGTFSANPITMTAGLAAMEMFDKEAVKSLNQLTQTAISQIKEAIKIADVPVSLTGSGSMFRVHLKPTAPKSYREAYQSKEAKKVLNELLDYLYHKEKLLLINTLSCMFSTAITRKEVDILSESMLNAFKAKKGEIDRLQKHI